jgi:hypothetical protein
LRNNPPVKVLEIGHLETVDLKGTSHQMPGGLVDNVRVPMDVDELGVREYLQKKSDPAGVRRRFQYQWPLLVPRQLFDQGNIGSLPPLNLSKGNIPKRQVTKVMLGSFGKHPAKVR